MSRAEPHGQKQQRKERGSFAEFVQDNSSCRADPYFDCGGKEEKPVGDVLDLELNGKATARFGQQQWEHGAMAESRAIQRGDESPHEVEVRVLCDKIHRLETAVEEKDEVLQGMEKRLAELLATNGELERENGCLGGDEIENESSSWKEDDFVDLKQG